MPAGCNSRRHLLHADRPLRPLGLLIGQWGARLHSVGQTAEQNSCGSTLAVPILASRLTRRDLRIRRLVGREVVHLEMFQPSCHGILHETNDGIVAQVLGESGQSGPLLVGHPLVQLIECRIERSFRFVDIAPILVGWALPPRIGQYGCFDRAKMLSLGQPIASYLLQIFMAPACS